MRTPENLVGKRFGHLVVIAQAERRGRPHWHCRCDCGGEAIVRASYLKSGHTRTCGCRRAFEDLAGCRFGRLMVIGPAPPAGRRVRWACECDCGAETIVRQDALKDGRTRSCGCLNLELRAERMRGNARTLRHGHCRVGAESATHNSWRSMLDRCTNPNHVFHRYYEDVTVCQRWQSFENFLADMGERPEGMSLDRIDPHGDYEPSNCRWATPLEQRHNRRAA